MLRRLFKRAEHAIIANPAKQGEDNKQLTNASNGVANSKITAVICTKGVQ